MLAFWRWLFEWSVNLGLRGALARAIEDRFYAAALGSLVEEYREDTARPAVGLRLEAYPWWCWSSVIVGEA